MRYHRKGRRFRHRSNGRNHQPRSDGEHMRIRPQSFSNDRPRNNFKPQQSPEKLAEKYSMLAKEALSSGDKILSENYLQHADHFTRILNERESFRKDKFLQNNSENNSEVIEENKENTKKTHDKDLVDNSVDEKEIQKETKPQIEII